MPPPLRGLIASLILGSSRAARSLADVDVFEVDYDNATFLASGTFGDVWKARTKSGETVAIKSIGTFPRRRLQSGVSFVSEVALLRDLTWETAEKLRYECDVVRELHSRGLPENCLQQVSDNEDAFAFIVLTFAGDLTLADTVRDAGGEQVFVWDHLTRAEQQQALIQLLGYLARMWQPPAIAHTDSSMNQILWNGRSGVGRDGIFVTLVDFEASLRCEEDAYRNCAVESYDEQEEEDFGTAYLTTSRDLHNIMLKWASVLFKQEKYVGVVAIMHGLFELPVRFHALTSPTDLMAAAASKVVGLYWFGSHEELAAMIPLFFETPDGFLFFMMRAYRIIWRGHHLAALESSEVQAALKHQYAMLQDLLRSSAYLGTLASVAAA